MKFNQSQGIFVLFKITLAVSTAHYVLSAHMTGCSIMCHTSKRAARDRDGGYDFSYQSDFHKNRKKKTKKKKTPSTMQSCKKQAYITFSLENVDLSSYLLLCSSEHSLSAICSLLNVSHYENAMNVWPGSFFIEKGMR